MTLITILGSPRRHGNTAAALAAFEMLAAAHARVQRINLMDYRVAGCLGCGFCQGVVGEPGCAQDDDAGNLLGQILKAEAVVYASPVYAWGFTAQMKALIDRQYCLTKWRGGEPAVQLLRNRRAALLTTCSGDAAGNADLITAAFDRQMACLGCEVVGKYVLDNCTTPTDAAERAAELAARMVHGILR